ncbi:hypothetical protein IAT40_005513 [Kwoniella sp. CBS 6097]
MDKKATSAGGPSSNWAKLQKTLASKPKETKKKTTANNDLKGKGRAHHQHAGKKQKSNHGRTGLGQYVGRADFARSAPAVEAQPIAGPSKITIPAPANVNEDVVFLPAPNETPLLEELRQMVAGRIALNESKKAPGAYIAIDCEMVGLGPMGSESALARVSIVNYHGHILLDTFVQPREKVTDWRTWISGIREEDVLGAPEFEEVQKKVAGIVEGRILVGHAIDNDLKVLLLSHPRPLIRDTQKCKMLREKAKNKHPGLKKLSEIELGVQIQKASHSSVTDARATMALYRIHKIEWERQLHHATEAYRAQTQKAASASAAAGGKRKRDNAESGDEGESGDEVEGGGVETAKTGKGKKNERVIKSFPGGGRKGISSGLGLIVRRNGQRIDGTKATYTAGSGSGGRGRKERDAVTSGSGPGGGSAGKWWEQDAS